LGWRTNSLFHIQTHLSHLEAEAIEIMREVVSEAENPVMLYSVGKDSAVMLHLAKKAFYPSPPPFPLMHVDTTWKFQEMYKLRDKSGLCSYRLTRSILIWAYFY
jgi:sulfate adenylyltransferase subunit 2